MPPPLAKPQQLTLPKPTLAMQLKAFQQGIRNVSRLIVTDSVLFKPCKAQSNLKHVGIHGNYAATALRLATSSALQGEMKKQLIYLSRKITSQKCDKFLAGATQLKTVNLNLKHKINWDAAIKGNYTYAVTNEAREVDTGACRNSISLFHCPVCKMAETSSNPKFHRQQLDNQIKCPFCAKKTLVKDWTCPCDIAWFRCDMHAYDTHQEPCSPNKKQKVAAPCQRRAVKRKATRYPMTLDTILQCEKDEHERKRAKINMPDDQRILELPGINTLRRRIKLPQVLLDRFPHLAN